MNSIMITNFRTSYKFKLWYTF